MHSVFSSRLFNAKRKARFPQFHFHYRIYAVVDGISFWIIIEFIVVYQSMCKVFLSHAFINFSTVIGINFDSFILKLRVC